MTNLSLPPPDGGAFDQGPLPLLSALRTAYRPREIRPGVTLFVPPGVYAGEEEVSSPQSSRLRRACTNVARIVGGDIPGEIETKMLSWRLVHDPYVLGPPVHRCLHGVALGHPAWGDRMKPGVLSSIVLAFAPLEGWALTLSRFYGLGEPEAAPAGGAS
jgi:hypothetical protein